MKGLLAGVLAVSVLLAGCGFKLRGAQNFAFESIAVSAPQAGPVANELRRAFNSVHSAKNGV